MHKVTVVTSGKGGVGKTTVVANLGAGLAMAGYQTLLIDMDLGLRNLDIVLGLESRVIYTILDVLQGRCRMKQALVRDKRYTNLYLLAAAQSADKDAIEPEQIVKLITILREDFDYILLDCPAGIEKGFRNSLVAADDAIVVVNPEVSSIRDADRVIGLLDAGGIRERHLVINRLRNDLMKKQKIMSPDDISDLLGERILGVIPESDSVVLSTNRGNPVIGERGKCSRAYAELCRRYQGEKSSPAAEQKRRFFFGTT